MNVGIIGSGGREHAICASIKDSKKTAITITHDIKLAMLLASKIILIDEGKVEWSGNPSEAMLSKNKLVRIFLNG